MSHCEILVWGSGFSSFIFYCSPQQKGLKSCGSYLVAVHLVMSGGTDDCSFWGVWLVLLVHMDSGWPCCGKFKAHRAACHKTGFCDSWCRHCWVWEISFVDIFLLVLLALFFSGLAYFSFADFVLESSCQQFWTYIDSPVGSVYKHKNLGHEFSIYYPKFFET